MQGGGKDEGTGSKRSMFLHEGRDEKFLNLLKADVLPEIENSLDGKVSVLTPHEMAEHRLRSHVPYEPSCETFFLVASADLARGMVGQLISGCWRADKCAKDWMSQSKSKNQNKTNKTNHNTNPKPGKDIQQPQ